MRPLTPILPMNRPLPETLEHFYLNGSNMPSGSYDPKTQARRIRTGEDPRAPTARMASNHELYHSMLATTTGFGTVSILTGAMMAHGKEEMRTLFQQLMRHSHYTHEAFATASGLFSVSRGASYDTDLLKDYPAYQTYFNLWQPLMAKAPHPILAQVALEQLTRLAMQPGLDLTLAKKPITDWQGFRLDTPLQPDARLKKLLSEEFLEVMFRAKPQLDRHAQLVVDQLHNNSLTIGDGRALIRQAKNDIVLDAFGGLYFELAKHRLDNLGLPSLDYNGHMAFTQELTQLTEIYLGVILPFRPPKTDETREDILLADFASETLTLHEGSLPAFIVDSEDLVNFDAHDFLGGTKEEPRVHILGYNKARLRNQYTFDPESSELLNLWPYDPLLALRRRITDTNSDELQAIELIGVSTPEALGKLAKLWPNHTKYVPIVSARTLQDELWRKTWFEILRGLGPLPVLLDISPFAALRSWRSNGLKILYHRVTMQFEGNAVEEAAKFEIFVWYIEQERLIYFTPLTANLAGAIAYESRKYPNHFISEASFVNENQDLLILAFSHVVREEWTFGFE